MNKHSPLWSNRCQEFFCWG